MNAADASVLAVRGRGLGLQRLAGQLPNWGTKMGFDRKLSTAEVSAAVERAFARQEGRQAKLLTRTDNPVIDELAALDTLEYELQRDTAAAGSGIRVSAL